MNTGLVVLLVALIAVAAAVPNGLTVPLDVDCNCVYDWRGPHGYYNYWVNSDIVLATYHDADHWSPDPSLAIVPCTTCFVNILGRAVTFIDQYTHVNELQVGGNEWDDAIVVVGGPSRNNNANVDLKIHYDFTPAIISVTGERLVTGETQFTIVGRGFGFAASDLTIVVADYQSDVPDADCYAIDATVQNQYPVKIPCPGRPSIITYPADSTPAARYIYSCTNARIYHRDSYITCTAKIPDVLASELQVFVTVPSGLFATKEVLSTYMK